MSRSNSRCAMCWIRLRYLENFATKVQIPVDSQGKRQPEISPAAFQSKMTVCDPIIVSEEFNPPLGEVELIVPEDLFFLRGPFSG